MKPFHLTIFLAVLSALLLPQCAHAQWSNCNYFTCESYGYFDSSSGEVYGYSRSLAVFWWPFPVVVYSDLYGPGGEEPLNSNQDEEYVEAVADVAGAPADAGTASVDGSHYYYLEEEYDEDGESEYPVQVGMSPYISPWGGESINDGDSGNFSVSVARGSPTSYLWGFSFPDGATANSPSVLFTEIAGSSPGTDGHWFAYPLWGSPPE
jgi:hypothetical protein